MGDETEKISICLPLSHYKNVYEYIYIINGLIRGLRRECDLQCPPRQQEKLRTNSHENSGTRVKRLKRKAKYTKKHYRQYIKKKMR